MEKSFQEEQKYLEETLIKFKDIIEETEIRLDAMPRMYRDNPILLAHLLSQCSIKLELLKKTENKPYFARINFKSDDTNIIDECYIGKVGVFDEDNKIVTVDWRAPIASIYYDGNIGDVSYEAPQGIITGKLQVKRQYDIEDKELKKYQDVDTVSNDEILKPYLGANADNRLKNIVSTIQAEQNAIIREKIFNNLIIQGVAGSGKTTVALHRIAYLVYNNIKNIRPDQYIVIGPNKFFVNYISSVLPDLDVNNVSQLTYDEIVKELLKEDFIMIPNEKKLITSILDPDKLISPKLRVSMAFKKAIDKFLLDFDKTIIPQLNFIVRGYTILPKSIMEEIYNDIGKNNSISYEILAQKIDKVCLIISKYIENNNDSLESHVHAQFYEKAKLLSKVDLEKERKNLEYVDKELRNNCKQSLKNHFSKARPKILSLYAMFLKNINSYINIESYNIIKDIDKVSANIKAKKVEFEDLAALIYLHYRIYGSNNFEKYRHTVIDEAQDFG